MKKESLRLSVSSFGPSSITNHIVHRHSAKAPVLQTSEKRICASLILRVSVLMSASAALMLRTFLLLSNSNKPKNRNSSIDTAMKPQLSPKQCQLQHTAAASSP